MDLADGGIESIRTVEAEDADLCGRLVVQGQVNRPLLGPQAEPVCIFPPAEARLPPAHTSTGMTERGQGRCPATGWPIRIRVSRSVIRRLSPEAPAMCWNQATSVGGR